MQRMELRTCWRAEEEVEGRLGREEDGLRISWKQKEEGEGQERRLSNDRECQVRNRT